jgi:hypothetical protein
LTPTLFRAFLIADIIFAFLFAFGDIALESELPQPLQDYINSDQKMGSEYVSEDTIFTFCSVYIIYALWNLICLLLLRHNSRNHAIAVTIIGIGLTPFLGPSVSHGLTATFYDLSCMLWGALLMTMFFSPIKEKVGPKLS